MLMYTVRSSCSDYVSTDGTLVNGSVKGSVDASVNGGVDAAVNGGVDGAVQH